MPTSQWARRTSASVLLTFLVLLLQAMLTCMQRNLPKLVGSRYRELRGDYRRGFVQAESDLGTDEPGRVHPVQWRERGRYRIRIGELHDLHLVSLIVASRIIQLIVSIFQETFLFVKDDVVFDGVALQGFLVGNITQGDPLGDDGYVA